MNGNPEIIQVIRDKSKHVSIDYFDTEWNLLDLRQDYPNSIIHIPKSVVLPEMLNLSKNLIPNMPFIRVDWYIVDGKLYFSEFTFYSDGG